MMDEGAPGMGNALQISSISGSVACLPSTVGTMSQSSSCLPFLDRSTLICLAWRGLTPCSKACNPGLSDMDWLFQVQLASDPICD